jgi:aspartyl-tRNA synthetase
MFERTLIEEAIKNISKPVTIAGWVNRTRDLSHIRFILLRDRTGEIQIVIKPDTPEMFEIPIGREDVLQITGCTVRSHVANAGVEFIPNNIKIINKSNQPLPFDIQENVKSELETRLDYRFLDFRTPTTSSIFKIQNRILNSFRSYLIEHDYLEFQPPCIIASASEGGADLFSIPYFEKTAYLAQSPQLYKQMAAISFEKVYTIVPIWRAEKFNTPTHLNEIRQMDIEQAFANDETVMNVLENVLVHILNNVCESSKKELKILERELQIPNLPFRRITYSEAIELLTESGENIIWGEDFTKTQEKKLTELLGLDVFFIKDWPSVQKAFYAMPHNDNPEIVHAFDLLYNGVEISSGTQRIHLPELLKTQIRKKGLNPEDFNRYIEAFSYGAPPHAGWSIGLERLTMTVAGQGNIRECTMFPRDRDRLVP